MEKYHYITTKYQSHFNTLRVKENFCSEEALNTCLYFKNENDAYEMLSEIRETIYNFCKNKNIEISWLTEEWVKQNK